MFARIFAASIWAHGAIPLTEYKYRNLKRVVLPVVDVLFALGGVLGATHGIPTLDQVFQHSVAEVGGFAFAVVAFLCLLGVSFPRFWLLEVWGKSALFGMMIAYVGSLVYSSFITHTSAAYVLSLAGACIALVLWRLSILVQEARDRGDR